MNTLNPKFFFGRALDYAFQNEKGFSNDPDDPGGPTKYGVTLKTLESWRGVACTIDDIKNLTPEQAMPLYDARYWTPIGGPELTQGAIAIALFDACILHGVGPTAGCAQRALKQCGYPEIIVDGKIGPKSLSALNSVNVAAFLQAFHASLILRIAEVIQAKPTSEKYRKGWTARADHYLLLV